MPCIAPEYSPSTEAVGYAFLDNNAIFTTDVLLAVVRRE